MNGSDDVGVGNHRLAVQALEGAGTVVKKDGGRAGVVGGSQGVGDTNVRGWGTGACCE